MSAIASLDIAGAAEAAARPRDDISPVAAIVLAFVFSLAFSYPRARDIWINGTYYDPDDAMRLVQVRAWLAGQTWFDLTAYRIDPPAGLLMHWSRIVDVPLAVLIKLFGLFFAPDQAERLTRIVFPLAMQLASIAAMARLAKVVAGPLAILPATLLWVMTGFMFVQFQPGRIDHDSLDIVLLIVMVGASAAALDPARWREAGLAAAAGALSLAINLEDLPFVIIACAVPPAAWICRGPAMGKALAAFGVALAASLVIAFVATVAPRHYPDGVCDALSSAHLTAGLMGSALCLALAVLVPKRALPISRLACAALGGAAILVTMAALHPACLGDPLRNIDPLLRALWLDQITEARPLMKVLAMQPSAMTMIVMPVLLSCCAMVYAAWREQGTARDRWITIAAFATAGVASCFWQIRASTSLAPIAVVGGAYVAARLRAVLPAPRLAIAASLASLVPFSTMGWALASPAETSVEDLRQAAAAACRAPAAYEAFAAFKPGLVFAPIDAGSHILVYSQQSVVAAPYHRNNDGNRFVMDALLADTGDALQMMRARGIQYVAFCPGEIELAIAADYAPGDFASALLSGNIPAAFVALTPAGSLMNVFALR